MWTSIVGILTGMMLCVVSEMLIIWVVWKREIRGSEFGGTRAPEEPGAPDPETGIVWRRDVWTRAVHPNAPTPILVGVLVDVGPGERVELAVPYPDSALDRVDVLWARRGEIGVSRGTGSVCPEEPGVPEEAWVWGRIGQPGLERRSRRTWVEGSSR